MTAVKTALAEQIEKCQAPKLPYLAWHEDAEQRIERGEQQIYCIVCRRWQWPDNLCRSASRLEE